MEQVKEICQNIQIEGFCLAGCFFFKVLQSIWITKTFPKIFETRMESRNFLKYPFEMTCINSFFFHFG